MLVHCRDERHEADLLAAGGRGPQVPAVQRPTHLRPRRKRRALRQNAKCQWVQTVIAFLVTKLKASCIVNRPVQQATEDVKRTHGCYVHNKLFYLHLVCQTLSNEVLRL